MKCEIMKIWDCGIVKMRKCGIVRLAGCLAVAAAVMGAECGVFPVEPEGPKPVAKDGMRVYMGGNLNGMNEYFATYLYTWIYSSTELKHFKLFKRFNGAHSYDNAKDMPELLGNVKPDVVIMLLGVDALYYGVEDSRRSEYKANWAAMADACAKAGTQLVLFSLPAKYGTAADDATNVKLATYADDLRAFAKERNLCFFDLHRASLGFDKEHSAGCLNDLKMAKLMLELFGIEVGYPHMTADFAAGTAEIDAPNSVVVKGKGQYEVTSPLQPLGFTYCGKAGAEWTGFGLKVANLPADCDEVRLVWTGHDATVKRADLEAGVNLEAVSPGWSPYRNVALRKSGKSNPFWNQLVLTARLPGFKRTVMAMENGRDRSEFYDMLQREIYAGVDRDYDEAEANRASYLRDPFVFTLTILPKGKDK